ncbi:hypothetical protein NP493_436g02001 [Ridgeia piscesae]|uniref:Sulfotransferase n=1 Tax=Ridgeia piscesae TaxID=27915 RepID=A0AAD9L0B2_RIDPI|nr:hypothetical protein NP493_436g02001 [Ridgeia piscesae]
MSVLRRLVCCGSVLNVVIVCVVFLWPNSCDDTDCAAGTTLQQGGAGFYGENITDSRVVVIKTHRERELHKYDRAILVIRDPYDAIVSEYNWRVCGNHLDRVYRHVYNTSVPDTRAYCALREPNGHFRRKETKTARRNLFTYAQRVWIRARVSTLGVLFVVQSVDSCTRVDTERVVCSAECGFVHAYRH